MEAWLAELEREITTPNPAAASSMNNNIPSSPKYQPPDVSFEQLVVAFDDDDIQGFISSLDNTNNDDNNNNNNNKDGDQIIINDNNNIIINNNDNHDDDVMINSNVQNNHQMTDNDDDDENGEGEKESKKHNQDGVKKRIRKPSQVRDHIVAERKRRESLSQMIISLSAIVPGLKKVDKTSVLGETIKYVKQLQEKVNMLEEAAAKQTVDSFVEVRKCQLILDDDDDLGLSTLMVNENPTNQSCDYDNDNNNHNYCGNDNDFGNNLNKSSLPLIEIKITNDDTFLLRVCCENHKGILAKLFAEIEMHDISVVNCNISPFNSLAFDITIIAKMQKGFNKNVKDLVKCVRKAVLSTT